MSITNQSLLSKIIEGNVKSRLTDHISSHNLLTPHLSMAFYARGNDADCLINEPKGDYSPSHRGVTTAAANSAMQGARGPRGPKQAARIYFLHYKTLLYFRCLWLCTV